MKALKLGQVRQGICFHATGNDGSKNWTKRKCAKVKGVIYYYKE
jgi:hypothetical protein